MINRVRSWLRRRWGRNEAIPDRGAPAIATRGGTRIVVDDANGRCVIRLETARGQRVTLEEGASNAFTITDQSGNSCELSARGVSVTATSNVRLTASTVTVAAGTVALNSGMVNVAGTVKCTTMIADSVVAASYTPGAGNIS